MKYEKPVAKVVGDALLIARGLCGGGSNPFDQLPCGAGGGVGTASCESGSVVTRDSSSCAVGNANANTQCYSGGNAVIKG
jgi:hypothetical protein